MSDGASKLLGVLGHPIGHSQSPACSSASSLPKAATTWRTARLTCRTSRTSNLDTGPPQPGRVERHGATQASHPVQFGARFRRSPSRRCVNTLVKTPQGGKVTTPMSGVFKGPSSRFSPTDTSGRSCLAREGVPLQCTTFWPNWALTQSVSLAPETAPKAPAPSEGHPLGTTKCRNGSCATTSWWSIAPLWACIPMTETWCRSPPRG